MVVVLGLVAPAKNAKQSTLSVQQECQHKQVVPETSRIRFACIIHVKISIALSWPYTGNVRLSVEMKAQRYIESSCMLTLQQEG